MGSSTVAWAIVDTTEDETISDVDAVTVVERDGSA